MHPSPRMGNPRYRCTCSHSCKRVFQRRCCALVGHQSHLHAEDSESHASAVRMVETSSLYISSALLFHTGRVGHVDYSHCSTTLYTQSDHPRPRSHHRALWLNLQRGHFLPTNSHHPHRPHYAKTLQKSPNQ